jgi:phage terminase small subunit
MKTKKELRVLSESLTNLQLLFVNGLIKGLTQRQAYLDAGGTAKKTESQDSSAATMFSVVKVRAYYDALMEIATFTAVMTREEALQRLTLTAKVSITDVCEFKNIQTGEDEDGKPIYQTTWIIKNSEDIPDHIAACIKSVTATKAGPKIELYNSLDSIKLMSEISRWKEVPEITDKPETTTRVFHVVE